MLKVENLICTRTEMWAVVLSSTKCNVANKFNGSERILADDTYSRNIAVLKRFSAPSKKMALTMCCKCYFDVESEIYKSDIMRKHVNNILG